LTTGDGDIPDIEEKITTREDRRHQLAELVGRLLARQWIDRVLRSPAPVAETTHPG
jgi:hypothetical protein